MVMATEMATAKLWVKVVLKHPEPRVLVADDWKVRRATAKRRTALGSEFGVPTLQRLGFS